MEWSAFFSTLFIVIVIVLLQWPKLKKQSMNLKVSFFVILFIGLTLSLFNLQHIPGPVSWINSLFKPFGTWMEQ